MGLCVDEKGDKFLEKCAGEWFDLILGSTTRKVTIDLVPLYSFASMHMSKQQLVYHIKHSKLMDSTMRGWNDVVYVGY